jgi:uncharacterized protein (DUF2141 family)
MNRFSAALVIFLAGSLATPVMAADINVTISGVRNANGSVIGCLWSSGWGFPNCEKGGRQRADRQGSGTGRLGDVRFARRSGWQVRHLDCP